MLWDQLDFMVFWISKRLSLESKVSRTDFGEKRGTSTSAINRLIRFDNIKLIKQNLTRNLLDNSEREFETKLSALAGSLD